MTLGEILAGVRLRAPLSPLLSPLDVQGLDYDSRRVQPGFLFFAFPGSRADGRQFARDAVDRGALAVASESPAPDHLDRSTTRAACNPASYFSLFPAAAPMAASSRAMRWIAAPWR